MEESTSCIDPEVIRNNNNNVSRNNSLDNFLPNNSNKTTTSTAEKLMKMSMSLFHLRHRRH